MGVPAVPEKNCPPIDAARYRPGISDAQRAAARIVSAHRMARQADGENASRARPILSAQRAAVGLDAFSGNRQAKSDARPVTAALTEGREQLFGVAAVGCRILPRPGDTA